MTALLCSHYTNDMPAFDHQKRRRLVRTAPGQKGAYVYVPAALMRQAGIDPETVSHYRVWGGRRGGLLLRLYNKETR